MFKKLIDWVGTIVVAGSFAVIFVTILNPLLRSIEGRTGVDLVGATWPNDSIYLGVWILFTALLHWFVFRKRKYKKRVG